MGGDGLARLHGKLVDVVTPLDDAYLFGILSLRLQNKRLLAPDAVLSRPRFFVEELDDFTCYLQIHDAMPLSVSRPDLLRKAICPVEVCFGKASGERGELVARAAG